jgi:hypothetical protein
VLGGYAHAGVTHGDGPTARNTVLDQLLNFVSGDGIRGLRIRI